MAQVQSQGNTQQQQKPADQQGNASEVNLQADFALTGDNSGAGRMVTALTKLFEGRNVRYKYGVIKLPATQVSIAYISHLYNNTTPVFTLAAFENTDSSIFNYVENNQSRYKSIASLFDDKAIAQIATYIKDEAGYSETPVFVAKNIIPATAAAQLDDSKFAGYAAQLVTAVDGRGPNLGVLKASEWSKWGVDFHNNTQGVVMDSNGIAQRSDWQMTVNAVQSDNNQSTAPTLFATGTSNVPGVVAAAGYINLRYVGPKEMPKQNAPADYDPKQLAAEMVISQIDAITTSTKTSVTRSLITLGKIGKIAQVGGWFRPLVNGLSGGTRRISSLAQHMIWAEKMDFKSFDKNPDATLRALCHPTAACVVKHRDGDGISGLALLLSEVAYGDGSAVRIILNKLDEYYGVDGNPKPFSMALVKALGREVQHSDIVATAIPTISGTYNGSTGPRSLDDMDVIDVAGRVGDNASHFEDYVRATSYAHRNHPAVQIRSYLHSLADRFYGGNSAAVRGDALDIVIAPTFINLLIAFDDQNQETDFRGVEQVQLIEQKLFTGGETFAVGSATGPAANTGYGAATVSGLRF